MRFEWDIVKSRSNRIKHGIAFPEAEDLFDGRVTFTFEAKSEVEMRFGTTGEIGGVLYTAFWTRRNETVRIISVRRARDAERREYRSVFERRDS